MSKRKKQAVEGRWGLGFLVLAALTVVAYLPALRAGFVWDDDTMLTQNSLIKAADGLSKFWATKLAPDYWPMTSTTLWVEWRLWGMQAAGYHATNLALHILEAGLLWAVLRRLRIPGAYLAALIYAVHPVNVESVAWIAQRKNLMAMLFYLASIWCFLKTDVCSPAPSPSRSPSEGDSSRASPWTDLFYWLSLIAFALAMLSKGSVAMMPLVLIGLIVWRRPFAFRDAGLLLPFFLVATALTLVDIWFQKHGSGEVIRQANFVERMLGAGAIVWFYLFKALWPFNLSFVYPAWRIDAENILWWVPLLGAVAFTGILLWRSGLRSAGSERWSRPVLFSWLYFCVMLVPVMGFTDVYFMKYSLVADHYEHMAIIGAIGLMASVWGMARDRPGPGSGAWRGWEGTALAGAVVLLLAALTWRQCGIYRDSETLFRDTIARNAASWMAHGNLGMTLAAEGREAEAIAQYHEALRLKPDYPETLNNLGIALQGQGRLADAIDDYRAALRLRPRFAEAHNDLSDALAATGRLPEAIAEAEEALRIQPDYADAENNLGNALGNSGRSAEAIGHFQRALQIDPLNAKTENNLGVNLYRLGRVPEALVHLERAAQLEPRNLDFHTNLGKVYQVLGRNEEANAQFEWVRRLQAGGPAAPAP